MGHNNLLDFMYSFVLHECVFRGRFYTVFHNCIDLK